MTDLSRRGILGAAFFGVVLAPFVRGTEAEAARRANLYSRRRFSPLRGRRFHLVDGGRRTPVRLVRISNLPGSPKGHNGCFALEFKAAKAGLKRTAQQARCRRRSAQACCVSMVSAPCVRRSPAIRSPRYSRHRRT